MRVWWCWRIEMKVKSKISWSFNRHDLSLSLIELIYKIAFKMKIKQKNICKLYARATSVSLLRRLFSSERDVMSMCWVKSNNECVRMARTWPQKSSSFYRIDEFGWFFSVSMSICVYLFFTWISAIRCSSILCFAHWMQKQITRTHIFM